jgi:circadian clock protein KaiC
MQTPKPDANFKAKRCPTGIEGLDETLQGGLPRNRLYVVEGEPGSGKTTLALQFLLEGARSGEKSLYITFSETIDELNSVAESHGWDISKLHIIDLSGLERQFSPQSQTSLFHPSEVELNQMTQNLLKQIEQVAPSRIVFDSVSEMRLLAENALRYRKQILALKQTLARGNSTVMFLDDLTGAAQDLQVQSIAHGVMTLSRLHHEFGGERRRIRILKLRGVKFSGGHHDFDIATGGLEVYPRMISAHHVDEEDEERFGQLSSGINQFDSLIGGGLDRGTASLFIGPPGTGKSTLASLFALAAVAQGEKVAFFCFDETIGNLLKRSRAIGMKITDARASGLLQIKKVDPAELSPGAFAALIKGYVTKENFKVVVIDSLNGYIQSMPQEQFLVLQLHELLAYLNNQGIVTILTLAQQGLIGNLNTPIDLTYLADTVILSRYFESSGAIKKALSVVKKRTGEHEQTIREYTIGKNGIQVGAVLGEFQGILTGAPTFHGEERSVMRNQKDQV